LFDPANAHALLSSAAEAAADYPYKIWGFGEGMALSALVEAGQVLNRPELVDRVADLVEPSLRAAASPTDHLIAVEALHVVSRVRPSIDVSSATQRFATAVLSAPRPVPGAPQVHRPDLPALDAMMWVDCMHTDGPGLVLAGHAGRAVGLLDEAAAVLQRDDGLFWHGFDVRLGSAQGVAWGRGQGWALHGLIHTAALAPASSALLMPRLERLLVALARHEESGRWHTAVDDDATPLENSVSALVAAAVLHGVASRVIGAKWLAMGLRAFEAAAADAGSDGRLPVSEATPVGDLTTYTSRELGVFPWGQGPLMRALLAYERLGLSATQGVRSQ
jgi:rhamnogalacturonyl hydrolase YesR